MSEITELDPGEKCPTCGLVQPEDPMTLAQALDHGTYLDTLLAQRREMTKDVRTVGGPAKAAMYRLIASLSKDIAALEAERKQEQDEQSGDSQRAPDEGASSEDF